MAVELSELLSDSVHFVLEARRSPATAVQVQVPREGLLNMHGLKVQRAWLCAELGLLERYH